MDDNALFQMLFIGVLSMRCHPRNELSESQLIAEILFSLRVANIALNQYRVCPFLPEVSNGLA